ncbi:hypothetical protein GETHPA_07690 [Geothrix rubra]|uniref:S23 ribosomal protein n=1 Tax=Geothrix rubra TaxID=2927977 RepID=A0ABQ5Q4L3_9BACT|nr:four helix bundle protein [Geothrix rubra]GLH69236.1 hypothetical protein GETHPA_07690 [Geothrix rubra]
MQPFRKLVVWEKSHRLVLAIYKATEVFPIDERFGLTQQLRRASVSIPSNIAEGCGLFTQAEKARHFQIASGSAHEVDYQLLLARDLHYLDEDSFKPLSRAVDEVNRMLASLLQQVRN